MRFFQIEPVIAVLSHSNVGSTRIAEDEKMREVVVVARERFPDLLIDGEMQTTIAFDRTLQTRSYPCSAINGKAVNTFIFPNLSAGNIAYTLMGELGGAELIGPILMGMRKAVHLLQMGSSVREIMNMAVFAAMDAAERSQ